MQPVRTALLAVLCAVLSGCATPPPSPQPPAAAPTPSAASPAEGEYSGTTTRYQADSRSCPHPGLVTVIVWDNKFQYHWDRDSWLDATIADDGSVHGGAPDVTLQGRRVGNRIEGDITNGICGFHFTLVRSES
jgi:hypothetical protein